MKVLGNNGYPKQFVIRKAVKAQIQNTDQPKQPYATIVILYVRNLSETIRRILSPLDQPPP